VSAVVTRARLHRPGDTFSIKRGPVTTTQLVMYAGASGDFNRIHYDHPFAVEKGLGGVIAHGMLTMAFAASCAVEAFGPESRISSIDARFTAPVRVGDVVEVTATVTEGGDPNSPIAATLTAEVDGRVVLRGTIEVTSAVPATPPRAGLTS
jgi:acyl dehydratase